MKIIAQNAGHELTADAAGADVLVVNTCAFIDSAKQESIDAILEMAQLKKSGSCSRLVVTGCLGERYREDLKKDRNITQQQAMIVELNLLIDLARSAAATEAGTAFTKRTLALLKEKAEELASKYPDLRPFIQTALEEASKRKQDIDDLLKDKDAPRDLSRAAPGAARMPEQMRRELRELGLL